VSNRLTKGKVLAGAIQIGSGDVLKGIVYGTLSVVHGTVLPNRMGTVTQALASLAAADVIVFNPPAAPTGGLGYSGAAPAAGTVSTFWVNPTAGTISPGTIALTYVLVDLT